MKFVVTFQNYTCFFDKAHSLSSKYFYKLIMKEIISKLLPDIVLKNYKYKKNPKKKSKFGKLNLKESFNNIYTKNHWKSDESISGTGSSIEQTASLRYELPSLFKKLDIKSVLDIPCGDFNWMKETDLSGITYIGADIVTKLINTNKKYGKENVSFEVLDLTNDMLPKSDLIICRDCFVHLSFNDIYASLKNIISSDSKYLLTTSFPSCNLNYDIASGEWRVLNFEIHPFNFPKPLLVINENCTEANGRYSDKAMVLWEIKKINLPRKRYRRLLFLKN
jgi:2-polyprenyl-3-methyl-5-hydroxy-6-metoxy-1,4-benzoquinol methylase